MVFERFKVKTFYLAPASELMDVFYKMVVKQGDYRDTKERKPVLGSAHYLITF